MTVMRILSAVTLLALIPGSLLAATTERPTRETLIGTWAIDCGKPPSVENYHAEYTSNDDGTLTYQPIVNSNRHALPSQTLSDFTPLGDGRMRVKFVRNSDHDVTFVIMQFRGSQEWTFNSKDSDGTVHIKDGVLLATGTNIAHFEKCD